MQNNRFLLGIRDACLSKDEIRKLRKQYKNNPVEEQRRKTLTQSQLQQLAAIAPEPASLGYFSVEKL